MSFPEMPALHLRTDDRHIFLLPVRIWFLCPCWRKQAAFQIVRSLLSVLSVCTLHCPSPFPSKYWGLRHCRSFCSLGWSSDSLWACVLAVSLQRSPGLLFMTAQMLTSCLASQSVFRFPQERQSHQIFGDFFFNFLKIQGVPVMAQLPTSPFSFCLFLSPFLLFPSPPRFIQELLAVWQAELQPLHPASTPRREGCFLTKASAPWEEFFYQ